MPPPFFTTSYEELCRRAEEPDFFKKYFILAEEKGDSSMIRDSDEFNDHITKIERRVWKDKLPDNNAKTVQGIKKLPTYDVPPIAIAALGLAMKDGATKYGRFNWHETGITASIFIEAAMRHLIDFMNGEDYAQDSKVHHLGHLMSCCAIILDSQMRGIMIDDRPKGDKVKTIEDFLKVLKNEASL